MLESIKGLNVVEKKGVPFLQFEILTTDYVVKYIKRRLNSRSSPYFTIEVKSDTEVIFKIHRRINSINEKTNRTTKS